MTTAPAPDMPTATPPTPAPRPTHEAAADRDAPEPAQATATEATPTEMLEMLDLLDLVQQVRSGTKPTPAVSTSLGQAAVATAATQTLATATTVAASKAPISPGQSQSMTAADQKIVPKEAPPSPVVATAKVDPLTLALVASQTPTALAEPTDGNQAQADAEQAPMTATSTPDAATLLLAAGQVALAPLSEPTGPSSNTAAETPAPDAGGLVPARKQRGDDAATAASLAARPDQTQAAAQEAGAETPIVADPVTQVVQKPVDPETAAAAEFETHMTTRPESQASATPVSSLPASSANIGTSLAPTGATAHAPAPVRHEILTGFGNRGWDQAVSQRVLWLAQDQLQQASLTLNPPHLGPIQVTVQIDNQQAIVQFVAAQPEVRQALQDALPVLREMFGQAGIALGQADVSSRNPERDQGRQSARSESEAGQPELTLDGALSSDLPITTGQGLINVLA